MVALSDKTIPAGWQSASSNGALFTLYENDNAGFNSGPYDPSAGCNAKSTSRNSDRCIPLIATMPVLDAAGSTALQKVNEYTLPHACSF